MTDEKYYELFGRMVEAYAKMPEGTCTSDITIIWQCATIARDFMSEPKPALTVTTANKRKPGRSKKHTESIAATDETEPALPNIRGTLSPTSAPDLPPPSAGIMSNKELNQRIDAAYMGEHVLIQPEEKPVAKKKLSPAEQRFYDYISVHPTDSKPQIQKALDISQANYYLLKSALRKKGWLGDNGEIVGLIVGSEYITKTNGEN